MATVNEARQVLDIAAECLDEAHANPVAGRMLSSAASCLDDANACYARAEWGYAILRAVDSLAYSVGIFHPEYKRAWNIAERDAIRK